VRKYAEVHRGRMIAAHRRNDNKTPEFAGPRFAVNITNETPEPQPGWRWDGTNWTPDIMPDASTRAPSQLDRIEAKVDQILVDLPGGGPP